MWVAFLTKIKNRQLNDYCVWNGLVCFTCIQYCVSNISLMRRNRGNNSSICCLTVVAHLLLAKSSRCHSETLWFFFHFGLPWGDIFKHLWPWVMSTMQVAICLCKLCTSTHKYVLQLWADYVCLKIPAWVKYALNVSDQRALHTVL